MKTHGGACVSPTSNPASENIFWKTRICAISIKQVNKYPQAKQYNALDRRIMNWPNMSTAVIRSLTTSTVSYIGIKTLTDISGCLANGKRNRQINADTNTTPCAILRSLFPVANVDKNPKFSSEYSVVMAKN
jgi:hypothetical protein